MSKTKWEAFLVEFDLAPAVAEHSIRRLDLQALLDGEPQTSSKRKDHHFIRLGKKSNPPIPAQHLLPEKHKGQFLSQPPHLPGLRSIQRKFSRLNQQIITDTIIDNDNIYYEATKETATPTSSAPAVTPSPPKRSKLDNDTKSPTSTLTLTQLLAATGAIPSSASQKSPNDDSVVVSYKDPRNFWTSYLVRLPQNSTDNSFKVSAHSSGWLERVLEINGCGDKFQSTKRLAKYLKRKHSEAFNEFLKEEKLGKVTQMSSAAVAAMFTAGGVTGRHQRKSILRVLRHHFGKQAFAPENKVKMLCEGATEIFTGSVDYAYESQGMKEEIRFTEKNIAREIELQLALSIYIDIVTSTFYSIWFLIHPSAATHE